MMQPEEEARRILEMYRGDLARAFDLISHQISVLQTRGTVLMTLSGAAITVSGFSGRLIAGTDTTAQILLVSGLFIVLFSAFLIFSRVMRVYWLSWHLEYPPQEALARAIGDRNRKQRHFHRAGLIFCFGALLFASSLGYMLLHPYGEVPPQPARVLPRPQEPDNPHTTTERE